LQEVYQLHNMSIYGFLTVHPIEFEQDS